MTPTPKPVPDTCDTLSLDQWLARLEEWSSCDQLNECKSTLMRFYVSRNTVDQAVYWLKQRESVLAECESTDESDEYQDRGESFGA